MYTKQNCYIINIININCYINVKTILGRRGDKPHE
jgi:hypothetical protein